MIRLHTRGCPRAQVLWSVSDSPSFYFRLVILVPERNNTTRDRDHDPKLINY